MAFIYTLNDDGLMHTFKVILHLYRGLKEQGGFYWSGSHFYTGSTNACNYFLKILFRYVPVGLLERLPQRINERPPYYQGRNELETLMSSRNCNDWIKIRLGFRILYSLIHSKTLSLVIVKCF